MSHVTEESQPLEFTRAPRLDNALRLGWGPFSRTLAAVGPQEAARWLATRTKDLELVDVGEPLFFTAIEGTHDEAADALFGIAELAEEIGDDILADTLWEGALEHARAAGDGDLVAETTRRLAALAERLGDPLAAAEFFIGFLNWRRQTDNSSDPEDVETAFDEIGRLAVVDGAQKAAAEYAYRQAEFTKLLDAEDARAVEGDWESDSRAYESWA